MQGFDGFFWAIAVGDSVYGVTKITGTDESMTIHSAVVAIDSATGDERWSTPLPDDAQFGAPTTDGSLVILAAGDGGLTALDAKTGAAVWSVTSAHPATATAIADGVAYVGLDGGIVTALATTDGSEVWRSTMDSGSVAAVTVVGDTVYVNGRLTLYALDAATGTERWRFGIKQGWSVIPAVTADTVYVGTDDIDRVRIDALDARTGAARWQLATEMYGAVLGSVANGGRLFVVASGYTGDPGLVVLEAVERLVPGGGVTLRAGGEKGRGHTAGTSGAWLVPVSITQVSRDRNTMTTSRHVPPPVWGLSACQIPPDFGDAL